MKKFKVHYQRWTEFTYVTEEIYANTKEDARLQMEAMKRFAKQYQPKDDNGAPTICYTWLKLEEIGDK